jgi:exodeoxyribonuclease VII large subunit
VPDRAALRRQAQAVFARWQHALARALELRMQRIDLVSRRLIHPAERIERQRVALTALGERLARAAAQAQHTRQSRLAHQAAAMARLLRTPPPARADLERRRERWQRAAAERIAATAQRTDACAQSLRHLNPLGVLDRGYSIVTDDKGAVVQYAGRLAIGDTLNVRFARGEAGSKVTRTRSG